MDKLLESLRNYLRETPKEALEELDYLNEIGPDVLEYAKTFRYYQSISMSYESIANESSLVFENSNSEISELICSDADYPLAA